MYRPTIKEAIRALEEAEVKLGLKICKAKRVKAFGWQKIKGKDDDKRNNNRMLYDEQQRGFS